MDTATIPKTMPSVMRATQAYVARQQERGFKQIKLWVPAALVEKFHNDAARARRRARATAAKGAAE